MSKIFMIAMLSLVLSSNVYAAEKKPTSLKVAADSNGPKKLTNLIEKSNGTIEALRPANGKDDLGGLTFVGEDGKKTEMDFIAKTRLFSSKSAEIKTEQLQKGDKVSVLFVKTIRGRYDIITLTQK